MIVFSTAKSLFSMILPTVLLTAHFLGVTSHPLPPPPPPPPLNPPLASTTTILSASAALAPLRNPAASSSATGYSIALYDHMAVIGDRSLSTLTLQTFLGDSNTWQELAYVNVSSVWTDINTSAGVGSSATASNFADEVAQSLALSSETILVSKVSKVWQYTDECPEEACQANWYDTECCPTLASSDELSLLVYSYDSSTMNVVLSQELSLPLISSSGVTNSSMTSEVQTMLSTAVTDIHTYFTSSNSFYTSVSWVLTNSSVIFSENSGEYVNELSYSSHSQLFFGSLSYASAEEGWEEESGGADALIASWNEDSISFHHESTPVSEGVSQRSDSLLTAVAVYESHAVQGFCNHSSLAQGAGVVFFYSQAGSSEWQLMQTLYPTVVETVAEDDDDDETTVSLKGAHFGSAVALQSYTLAVGAYGLECAFLYSFNQTQAAWQLHSTVTASDGVSGSLFGFSLQLLNANQLAVGAPLSIDSSGIQSGSVFQYGYLADLDEWTELSKAQAANASSGACFGSTIEAVAEHLFLVAAFPSSVVLRGEGASLSLSSSSSSANPHRVYSLNFTDCATYTTCTEAKYNATTNETTPELCTTYSTCSAENPSFDTGSNGVDSNRLMYFVLFVGASILVIPAVLLGVSMMRSRLQAPRGEYLADEDHEAAPVQRMTPLNTLEEGGVGSGTTGGAVGESPVGRPPLVGMQKKGRGNNSYTSLTSQMQVEPSSPVPPSSSSSSSSVGGLLSKLRSNLQGGIAASSSSAPSTQDKDASADINSPGGPPRGVPVSKKSPFTLPAVEE